MPTTQLVARPVQTEEPRPPFHPAPTKQPKLTQTQTRLLALLLESPGMTIRQLTTPMASSHATVTYHLAVLVRKSILVRERDGRNVRHYPAARGRSTQYLEALYREPRKRAILLLLVQPTGNVSVNKMAKQLQVPFGFLKRTLIALERQGFVRLEAKGVRYTVHIQPPLRAYLRSREVSGHPDNGFDGLASPMP